MTCGKCKTHWCWICYHVFDNRNVFHHFNDTEDYLHCFKVNTSTVFLRDFSSLIFVIKLVMFLVSSSIWPTVIEDFFYEASILANLQMGVMSLTFKVVVIIITNIMLFAIYSKFIDYYGYHGNAFKLVLYLTFLPCLLISTMSDITYLMFHAIIFEVMLFVTFLPLLLAFFFFLSSGLILAILAFIIHNQIVQ